MAVAQFVNSLMRIARNPHIHRGRAVARHLAWQLRKLTARFPVELRLSNSALIATHGRCGISALVNTHGMYDYNNMTLIQLMLSGGGLFVDVGANIGAYTLIASELGAAQVLAFEPHPVTFAAMLLRSVQPWGMSPVWLRSPIRLDRQPHTSLQQKGSTVSWSQWCAWTLNWQRGVSNPILSKSMWKAMS